MSSLDIIGFVYLNLPLSNTGNMNVSTLFVVTAYHCQPNLPLRLKLQVRARLLVVLTWICLLFPCILYDAILATSNCVYRLHG